MTQTRVYTRNPVLCVIPMESVLGRLSLFPVGNTGTIPFESTASNPAEHEALAEFTTPVLSVIRRRALATVADCGISMCLPSHGLATCSKHAVVLVLFSDCGA